MLILLGNKCTILFSDLFLIVEGNAESKSVCSIYSESADNS